MTLVHIAISGNLAPDRHIPSAMARMPEVGEVVGVSRFLITPAIGRPFDPDYWNGVIAIDTPLNRAELGRALHTIEADEGRVRTADAYASRTMDLDLLLWDDSLASAKAEEEISERPWIVRSLAELGVPGFAAEDLPDYPEAPVTF